MSDGFTKRLPMDTRMVREISRSPQMMQEQGSGFLSGWGGAEGYQYWGSVPWQERMVYDAVVNQGATNPSEISVMTDIPEQRVGSALTWLVKKGHIQKSVQEAAIG